MKLKVGDSVRFKATKYDRTGGVVREIRADEGKVPIYGVEWNDSGIGDELCWYYRWDLKRIKRPARELRIIDLIRRRPS